MHPFFNYVLTWLSPVTPIDEEHSPIRTAVSLVTSASIVLLVLPALIAQFAHGWWEEFWVQLATLVCLLATLWLNHNGRPRWAARLLAATALASAILMVHFSGLGIRDTSVLVFPAILVVGALILDAAFFLVFATGVVGLLGVEVVLQIHHLNPNSRTVHATYADLAYAVSILALTATAGGLLAAAFRRSNSRYQSLVRQLGEGVLLLDPDRYIRVANPAAERIFNVPSGRLVGRNLLHLIVEQDRPGFQAQLTQSKPSQPVFFELNVVLDDKSLHVLDITSTPRISRRGKITGSIAVIRDVTEERRMAERIRLLAHALECAGDCICISDTANRILYANASFSRTYGYEDKEILGQHISIVQSPRVTKEMEDQILSTSMQDGWRGELWNKSKDGKEFPISLTTSLVRDDQKNAIAIVGVARDITEKKRADEALAASERQFRGILEHAHLASLVVDLSGRIAFCNRSLFAALGYKWQGDIIGHSVLDFIPPDQQPKVREMLEQAAGSGRVEPFNEIAVITAEGGQKVFQWNNALLYDTANKIVGVASLGFDVTEHRAVQEQYIQSQKMESIGRLAGGVAHDFNNLLTIINGYSQVMLSKVDDDDPLRPDLEEIHKAGARAAALTGRLLAYSRKQVRRPQVIQLNDVIRDMVSMLRRLVGGSVILDLALNADARQVLADPHQLEQVVMNLAVNAADAMPHGGQLRLATRNEHCNAARASRHPGVTAGKYVVLVVSDNGHGMDEATQKRIFEPFFTTKEVGKGTGLGLSMVHGIVQQSNGFIDVTSAVGSGTTFSIYLPAAFGGELDQGQPETPAVVEGRGSILVVDDEPAVRRWVAEALRSDGYRVLEAQGASEALSICQSPAEPVDLLLADVMMPGMNGVELASRLQKVRPRLKVLFMSGFAEVPELSVPGRPVAELIRKPFSFRELAARVQTVLSATLS